MLPKYLDFSLAIGFKFKISNSFLQQLLFRCLFLSILAKLSFTGVEKGEN